MADAVVAGATLTGPLVRKWPHGRGATIGYPRFVREGLYDLLLTKQVRARLERLKGLTPQIATLAAPERAERLARFLADEVRKLLADHSSADGQSKQAELVNELLFALSRKLSDRQSNTVSSPEELLLALHSGSEPPERPFTPLALSTLLARPGKPDLGQELGRELVSADRVDGLVSFVTWTGYRRLRRALEHHAAAGRPLRLITTTYTGATEAAAVRAMARCLVPRCESRSTGGAAASTPRPGSFTARQDSARYGSAAPTCRPPPWPAGSNGR